MYLTPTERKRFDIKKITEHTYNFILLGEELTLLPQKAVYFKKHNTVLAADLHLGKSSHFRKEGIPVPAELAEADLRTLSEVIAVYKPEKLIILGDLFHAETNYDLRRFGEWRNNYKNLEIDLIKGNHDTLLDEEYKELKIHTYDENLIFSKFLLTHKPDKKLESENKNSYIISAHVHPAVKLVGKGKQSVTLPCFYFGESRGLLPAFGRFTGKALLQPGKDDKVFVIIESGGTTKVIPVR
jgi:DNA ligase-associated metallophosphoesterase